LNRQYFDYSSGYCVIFFESSGDSAENNYYNAALFPLDKFLETFLQPHLLADRVEEGAREAIEEWILMNGPETVGTRTPAVRDWRLMEHQWRVFRTQHKAIYEMSVNR
jgi:hypothetical protein